MRTTTMLEVMAEVSRSATEIESLPGAQNVTAHARASVAHHNIEVAIDSADAAVRRDRLVRAASWALLALHAHDAEAAKAGA